MGWQKGGEAVKKGREVERERNIRKEIDINKVGTREAREIGKNGNRKKMMKSKAGKTLR